jgi:hypothetical protein
MTDVEIIEVIRPFSVEGQPTKAVIEQTCMGVFFIHSVCDTTFAIPSFFEIACGPLRTTWRTATDHRWSADYSLINTALVNSPSRMTENLNT